MRRYIFVMAAVDRPVGGRNVILRVIDRLNASGFAAHPMYPLASYTYNYHSCTAPAFFDPRLVKVYKTPQYRAHIDWLKRAVNVRYITAPGDVIVAPEFRFPEISAAFPDQKKICFVQDVYGFVNAYLRDIQENSPSIDNFDAIFTTSEASRQAVEVLLGKTPKCLKLEVDVSNEDYEKEPIVAYMPRKRREEAEMIVSILKGLPELSDYKFVRIEKMTPAELKDVFRRTRIFLSFSRNEGFGLPPAEAMGYGAIVVGYSGVGGNEYFTRENGFPIEDGNIIQFVETVRSIVRDYEAEPSALDKKRAQAQAYIAKNYSARQASETLLSEWRAVHQRLEGE